MKRQILLGSIIFFFLTAFISSKDTIAAPYYQDKMITILVGGSVGNGYDRMSRLMAKPFAKYIPGNPTIVIQNIIGGGGIIAANNLYNLAKPDGLTIGCLNRSFVYGQLLKLDSVKFDMSKFCWIGSMGAEASVLAMRSTLPYKTINDLKNVKDTFYMGNTGPLLVGAQFVPILRERLGPKLKLVTYSQSAEIILAMERGEMDSYGISYSNIKPHMERGGFRPLMRGLVSTKETENLPVHEDLTTDNRTKKIVSILGSSDRIGRPFLAPPGTPPNIMKILRDAFFKATEDPEVKEGAKKLMIDPVYIPEKKLLEIVNYVINQPPDVAKEISKY